MNWTTRTATMAVMLGACCFSATGAADGAGNGTAAPVEHNSTGAVTAPSPAAELAAFADGPWKGMNAVYQGRLYDATLDAKGSVVLYPKDKGERVGKPIVLAFGCHYYDPVKKNTVVRPIAEVSAAPPQVLARSGSVKLTGRFADDVRFTVDLRFTETAVAIEGEIKDPAGLTPASNLGYHAHVQPTHNPPAEMALEQIKALMPDWTLVLTPMKGKTQILPYWKSLNPQGVERAQIRGPWGARQVTIKAPGVIQRGTKVQVAGYLSIYQGFAAYTGFYVGRAGTSEQEAGELIVSFE